jgi:uncharacterized membrane-anchored protein YhcB (DUF1043 family)
MNEFKSQLEQIQTPVSSHFASQVWQKIEARPSFVSWVALAGGWPQRAGLVAAVLIGAFFAFWGQQTARHQQRTAQTQWADHYLASIDPGRHEH